MFRRDFVASLFSLLPASLVPASWVSAPGGKVPDIRKAIEDGKRTIHENTLGPPVSSVMGLVTEHHCSRNTNFVNPNFSAHVTMEGWFRVVGGPSVLEYVITKVREGVCDSPVPRPLACSRRLGLSIVVSSGGHPEGDIVHWYAVDNEDLPKSQASTPNP